MPRSLPPQYPGDASLERLLKKLKCPLSLTEVKAYVMGVILCPDLIMPSAAIERIWELGNQYPPQYKDLKEAQNFLSSFMGLWNQMAEFQTSKALFEFSSLPQHFENSEDFERVLRARLREVCVFLDGFTDALEIDPPVEDYNEAEVSTYPYPILLDALLGQYEEMLDQIKKKKSKLDLDLSLEILHAGDRRLAQAFPHFIKYVQRLRRGEARE